MRLAWKVACHWLTMRRVGAFLVPLVVIVSTVTTAGPAQASPTFGVSGGIPCGNFSALGSASPVVRSLSDTCANGDSGYAAAEVSGYGLGAAAGTLGARGSARAGPAVGGNDGSSGRPLFPWAALSVRIRPP